MKIGILTFHFAYNYGAMWQCYGLQQALKRLGYNDVEVINVIPSKWHWFLMGIPLKISIDSVRKALIKLKHYKENKKPFDVFRKQYITCSNYFTMDAISECTRKYDAIIVGSDQVWAPSQQKDCLYFLNWQPAYRGLKIAYAPCCALKATNIKHKDTLRKALNDFNSLSARNDTTCQFVENITGKKVPLVPDPTMLTDYSNLITNDYKSKTKYILSFVLGSDIKGGNDAAISKLKELYKEAKIIAVVAAKSNPIIVNYADEVRYNVTPVEWLNLIAHAQLVYTDSFHCTVFSMKFHVPFIAYYSSPTRKSRFVDLSNRFAVGDHIITSVSELSQAAILPPADCDTILEEQRRIGDEYITNSLR
jgi:hypothetical protein